MKMKQIQIGTCIPGTQAEKWIPYMVEAGFECVAINFHMSLEGVDLEELAKKVKSMLDGTGVRVATLGYYCNAIENPDHWETLRHVVEMAPLFGAPMVSTFAGAYEGKSVEDAMPKFKEVFTDITKRAADKGLKVAIENCPMGGSWQHCTCNIGFNPKAWEMMFNEVPAENLGLEWPEEVSPSDPAPEQPETGAPAVASLEELREELTRAIAAAAGCGVPTIKPWDMGTIRAKMAQAKESGCFAVAMDVDAAGLPFLKHRDPPAGCKSAAELREIAGILNKPFIVKGIMTVKGALKAQEAGAAAIVVSNHGGRVLDQCPATAEVLPEIVSALRGSSTAVLVDGGIRSGADVFKALAMGAAGVLIARPFVTAVYGGGEAGVRLYIDKIGGELADAMQMCGARTLADITPEMIRLPR